VELLNLTTDLVTETTVGIILDEEQGGDIEALTNATKEATRALRD